MAIAKKKPPKKPKPKKKVGKPPPPKEPPTPPGARIGFRTTDGSVSQVVCFRGETSAVLSDGVGGWDVEDRPRRVAATIWGRLNAVSNEGPYPVRWLAQQVDPGG